MGKYSMSSALGYSPESWNMAGGFHEILQQLLVKYYEASLSEGLFDDLELMKRLLDHTSCKFTDETGIKKDHLHYYTEDTKKSKEKPRLVSWFDNKIEEIEIINTNIMNMKIASPTAKQVYIDSTKAKKLLRLLHRELMNVLNQRRIFDIERKYNTKEDFMGDLG